MNVQLLLLLALVGPFCAFTHASTELPVASIATGTAAAKPSTEDVTLVTSSAANEPATAPAEVTPEAVTEAAPPSVTVNTEEPVVETHAPAPAATEAPKPITTDPPSVETAAPSTEAEFQSKVTAAAETKMDEEVHKGGLSSGQVVGIVIGALLAVVIVIAVVIATVRRMGKYSSAKNKKPAKKDSIVVSSLRKKPAKQQERPKFWKF